MTSNKMTPNVKGMTVLDEYGQLAEVGLEQVGQQPQRSEVDAAAQPAKRVTPPRRPLFRH